MKPQIKILVVSMFSGLCMLAWPRAAEADELVYEMIPASSCRPAAANEDRVEFLMGGWRFVGAHTGTVTLRCPVRSSHFHIDLTQTELPSHVQNLFLYYVDPDGMDTDYSIKARLYRSTPTQAGASSVGPSTWLSSNSKDDEEETWAKECLLGACVAYEMVDALYFIHIDLSRTDSSATPSFVATGLSFDPPN